MRRVESKRERRAAERRLNRGIGWRIAATRQRLGLSISDAAEHIGITPSTMRKLESGGPCLPRQSTGPSRRSTFPLIGSSLGARHDHLPHDRRGGP